MVRHALQPLTPHLDSSSEITTYQFTPKMSETLKPQFWVLRQNGSIVPLVAVDELPHNIRIEDVPRTMNVRDTVGMINIGEYPSRHRHHVVVDTNAASTRFVPPKLIDTSSSDDETPAIAPQTKPANLVSVTSRSYGIREHPPSQQESMPADTSTNNTGKPFGAFESLPPWQNTSELGDRVLVPGKKVYCTHWMSTGECDYAQQGCLYKHEMPINLNLLNALGYQDIPKWYREKHGIGKLTAAPGSGASVVGSSMRPSVNTRTPPTATWNGFVGANKSPRVPSSAVSKSGKGSARRGPNAQTKQGRTAHPVAVASPTPTPAQPAKPSSMKSDANNPLNQSQHAPRAPASHNPFHAAAAQIVALQSTVQGVATGTTTTPANPTALTATSSQPPTQPEYPTISFPETIKHKFQNLDRPQPVNTHRTDTSPSNGSTSCSPHHRRRSSSLYSDPEADIIRENTLRRQREEREYAVICEARRAEMAREREREKRGE